MEIFYMNGQAGSLNETVLGYYRLQVGDHPPDGWFVVWTKGRGIFPFHSTNIAGMAHKVGELQQQADVYVGMALQKTAPEPGKRGSGENTAAICGVWIEIDCKEGVHKEQALPTKEQALGLLKGLPVIPTVIMDSGGGYHAHWWLDTPLVFTTDDERQRGQDLVRRFQQAVAQVFQQRGFKVDTTSDLARVLRPPHTFNHKSGQPVLVTVAHYEDSLRYRVNDLDACCPAAPPANPPSALPKSPMTQPVGAPGNQQLIQYPPVELQPIIDGCAWMRHCRDDAATLPEPEWFAALSIVVRCANGEQHAHALSSPYPGYSVAETEAKISHALAGGPRTCTNIRDCLNAAAYCANCPHLQHGSSPITLGFIKTNAAQTPPTTVHSMLPDAPVSVNALVPGSMILSIHDGITAWVDNGKGQAGFKRVFPVAIVLVERLKCVHTGKEQVKIAWHMDDAWHFQMVDRKVIADTRDIVSLASFGLPITSEHKEFLVKYLSAYDFVNRRCIPRIQVSSRFGWQDDNISFLWGRNLITQDGMLSAAAINTKNGPSAIGAATIVFRGSDDGDEQVADGFDCSGSLAGWLNVANRAIVHPIPFVVMLASCAPPLLTLIGASNFVVETAGVTSTGKTSTQRLAASVWGCPDERAEASVLHTWDTTRIWVERTGGLLNGLPLILDDTKRVFSSLPTKEARALVNAVVYAYASGKGRGRGSVQGTQRTGAFRSVLISSGEEPCTGASTQHGGARARVLSLWGAPFGATPQSELVKDLNVAVMANYGFAGPYLVHHLLVHRTYWAVWKEEFQQLQGFYATLAEGNNVAGRLAEIFAVLEFTAVRLQEALPGLVLPRPTREVLLGIWAETVADAAQDADRALAALRDVAEWSIANQQKFYGRHKSDGNSNPIEPFGGFVGRFDAGDQWTFIAFLRKPLCDLLEKFGHDVSATLRVWSERGWLLADSKGRNQRQVRINGSKAAAYCINRVALENELGMDFRPDQVASNPSNPFGA